MRRSKHIRAAWAMLGLVPASCTLLLGVDPDDYHLQCLPGELRCTGNVAQRCGADGLWTETACMSQTCIAGACAGECGPGEVRCAANVPQTCGVDGQWQGETACVGQTCIAGACVGQCEPGDVQCADNMPQSCDATGYWQSEPPCPSFMPVCNAGVCSGLSCVGLPPTCGPGADESCCAHAFVSGGTYNRMNNPAYPATVSDFRLDRFEITVGRFRAFVAAYPGSKPAAGAGAHPLIAGSGWDAAWDGSLPSDQAALQALLKCDSSSATWTDLPASNENLPVNCLWWTEAFAFCAWDGGRLPTEAEWNYAAAGGSEQRS